MTPEMTIVIATHDNLALLQRCLEGWRTHASHQPVELLVVEDGCRDGTADYLRAQEHAEWGRIQFRWVHEDDAHELRCTNRGLREARAPLVTSWHDDMFLECDWMVPELLATFSAYPEIGLLALSRGLRFGGWAGPLETFEDSIDWRRLVSTIGSGPLNWLRLSEVDGVMRPWTVRRACIDQVGALDEEYRPTEWDESDLSMRIRAAGWKVATHGYERDGAYVHQVSSTLGRHSWERRTAQALRNAKIFFGRWQSTIAAEQPRDWRTWWRRVTPRAAAALPASIVGGLARRVRIAGARG
ncbi:MAG: hypothetical protein JWO05_1744 [Gemmatimonadetes bacterium]|nr:hypothetical protein [Gemmatimonadota bacterium]